ncbi:lysozyme [Pseudomonas nitroreducens]|uniref:lysozyme n=1 Tax=Pseudomonas nitroreducens TaxID=46680 RepID=UPI00265A9654|nr:lysozyme [Pseudomonas nitroreducens]MCP1652697.1 lysozyme [Pseudomonas nitroreducens]
MAKLKIPAAILAAILAGGGAVQVLDVAVPLVEGNPYKAYPDIGGVWTICGGVTKGVTPNQVETPEGCRRRNAEQIAAHLADVDRCVTAPMSEPRRAGLALFAYNVGGGAFCASTLVKLMNAGRSAEACAQLDRWVYVAGKDCRKASSNCPGIVHRRALERGLCEWTP